MPPRKRRVTWQGREVEATIMPFQTGGEHFNEYLVEDGTVVKLKLVVTEILRLDDEYDAEGNPIYVVISANVPYVSAPDELRQKRDDSP
jgi:hypothetical protein